MKKNINQQCINNDNKFTKLFTNSLKRKFLQEEIDEYNKMDKKPILFVKNLTKIYSGKKVPAINKLSFNVYPGQFHAFIGGNGAGKTTTIKSLIGAYFKWSGTILIDGIRNDKEEAKLKIGYIPENARFPEQMSARSYLLWMIMLSGIPHDKANKVVTSKLKELNMWNLRNRSPNTFSSGQKKKILLAQALIHDPEIIIMDEPVANLDPRARQEFFEVLIDLKNKGKAIFISSHVLAELNQYFDSATILDGGKIVYSGTKEELLSTYAKEYYKVKTQDDLLVQKYLKQKKNEFKLNKYEGFIQVYFKDNKEIVDFQKFILKNDIALDLFEKSLPSLEQVYDKLIIKGSVDTMKVDQEELKKISLEK